MINDDVAFKSIISSSGTTNVFKHHLYINLTTTKDGENIDMIYELNGWWKFKMSSSSIEI
ncbi:hypothetical protein Glove_13g290 [Diversispora epigaea]|uniref:Uncharacterized protein n=1 Tax=Diversispora epigaea TaxID=1348612 RepID=A0A397JQL5_9GLOM|nr:hypothetical protein Glove_13g290 [Diversispora epigaea]